MHMMMMMRFFSRWIERGTTKNKMISENLANSRGLFSTRCARIKICGIQTTKPATDPFNTNNSFQQNNLLIPVPQHRGRPIYCERNPPRQTIEILQRLHDGGSESKRGIDEP